MSQIFRTFLVPEGAVKSCFGSRNTDLMHSVKRNFRSECEDINDAFSDEIRNGAPTVEEAIEDIVNGEVRCPDAAFQYGNALELICRELGEDTRAKIFEDIHDLHSWAERDRIYPEFFEDGEVPIDIPKAPDFPFVGCVSVEKAERILLRHKNLDIEKLEVTEAPKGLMKWFKSPVTRVVAAPPNVVQARRVVKAMLERAISERLEVFTFYV